MANLDNLHNILQNPKAKNYLNQSLEEAKIGANYSAILRHEEQPDKWLRKIVNDANSMRLAAIGEVIKQIVEDKNINEEVRNLFANVKLRLPEFRQHFLHAEKGQEIPNKIIDAEISLLQNDLQKTTSLAQKLTTQEKELFRNLRDYVENTEFVSLADLEDPNKLTKALKDAANFREIRSISKVKDAVIEAFPTLKKNDGEIGKAVEEIFDIKTRNRNDLAHRYIWNPDGYPQRDFAGTFANDLSIDGNQRLLTPHKKLLELNEKIAKEGIILFSPEQISSPANHEIKNINGEGFSEYSKSKKALAEATSIHNSLKSNLGKDAEEILAGLPPEAEKGLYNSWQSINNKSKPLYEILEQTPPEYRTIVLDKLLDIEEIIAKKNPENTLYATEQISQCLQKFHGAKLSEGLTEKIINLAEKAENISNGKGIDLLDNIEEISSRTKGLWEKLGDDAHKLLPVLKTGAKLLPLTGFLFTAQEANANMEKAKKALDNHEITPEQYAACEGISEKYAAGGLVGETAGIALGEHLKTLALQANLPNKLCITTIQEDLGMAETGNFRNYIKPDGSPLNAAEMQEQIKNFITTQDADKYPAASSLYKIALMQGLTKSETMEYLQSEQNRAGNSPANQPFPLNSAEKWKELRDGAPTFSGILKNIGDWISADNDAPSRANITAKSPESNKISL